MKRIIYANSNHNDGRYIKEAIVSAQSFRKFVPDCEIVLYTNEKGFQDDVFDRVFFAEFVIPDAIADKDHKNGQMAVKHQAAIDSPAEQNLVLGSDTLALSERVNDAFALLERFDFAAVHAPTRIVQPIPGIPDAWPEFNCDVIFFRKNEKTDALLQEWRRIYVTNEIDHPHDQGAFRYLTYHRDVQVAALPYEYNDRAGLFGNQVSEEERKANSTVILQNRYAIAEILAGNSTLEEVLERQLAANTAKKLKKRRSFLQKVIAKVKRAAA